MHLQDWLWRARYRTKQKINAGAGAAAIRLLKGIRRTDPDRSSNFAGGVMRRLGPWLPEHRVGRANLKAAFPEKSPAEIEAILRAVWENLGRVGAEYAHLDKLWDFDPARPEGGRIQVAPEHVEVIARLKREEKPVLFFAAHLGNWELPALAAAAHGLNTAVLYRAPNIGDLATAIQEIRSVGMGTLIPTGLDAPVRMAAALERGALVGMLVDQHFARGVDVTFFGRPCKANPLLARLARQFNCAIYGIRSIRLPGHRFRIDLTDPMQPARNMDGTVDVPETMQMITSAVERWVREHPEQWLWVHNRWR